jgi:hypothetical protein
VVAHRLGAPKLSLTQKSYIEAAEVMDSQLLHLQYNQAVYNVITGQYPTTPDQAIEFGVFHFLYKFGSFDETRHVVGFLSNRIVEFLPYVHLRKSDLIEWETKLLDAVQAAPKGFDPQRRYLETVMLRLASSYGTVSFRATQVRSMTIYCCLSIDFLLFNVVSCIIFFKRSNFLDFLEVYC